MLGAVHGGLFTIAAVRAAVAAPRRDRRAAGGAPAPSQVRFLGPAELPWAMPALLEGIPRDARLLVVTDALLPLPVELYTAPRPTRVLCGFPERLLAPRRELDPAQRAMLELRFDTLERSGLRFTPERYERELRAATHLLLIQAAPREWRVPGTTLHRLCALGEGDRPAAEIYEVAAAGEGGG